MPCSETSLPPSRPALAFAAVVCFVLFLLLLRESMSCARLYQERTALEAGLRSTCDRLESFDPHDPTLLAGRQTLETYRDHWFETRR